MLLPLGYFKLLESKLENVSRNRLFCLSYNYSSLFGRIKIIDLNHIDLGVDENNRETSSMLFLSSETSGVVVGVFNLAFLLLKFWLLFVSSHKRGDFQKTNHTFTIHMANKFL